MWFTRWLWLLKTKQNKMLITSEQLTQIASSIKGQRAVNLSKELSEICPLYGINTPDIFHEFIARLLHECAEFSRYEENLNYSVEGLLKTFGRHRISKADAEKYGRIDGKRAADKQSIGNILYGGAWGKANLGNKLPNDGYNLRGSGGMQLTGRWVIQGFTDYFNKTFSTNYTIDQMANLLRDKTQPKYSIHGSCWVFAIFKKLITAAINDQLKAIVKSINGAYLGLKETQHYYNRAVASIK